MYLLLLTMFVVSSTSHALTINFNNRLLSKFKANHFCLRPNIRLSHPITRASFSSSTSEAETRGGLSIGSLMEMDIVAYTKRWRDSGSENIVDSEVREIGAIQEDGSLAPLCAWTLESAFAPKSGEDPSTSGSLEFLVNDEINRYFDTEDIVINKLVPTDFVGYGSRQVGGGKGPGNPHGEESEMLYYVDRGFLEDMKVKITLRPELEILW